MGDTSGPIDTGALRAKWKGIIGPFPGRCDLHTRILSTETLPDHERHLLQYKTEEGASTEAYLLVPNRLRGLAPAAVVFHATSDSHIRQPVGLADQPTRHIALGLVRRGWITISPRCYIYGYRGRTWVDAVAELELMQPGLTGIGKMTWDGMRALDVLAERADVDPARLAAVGHSLGAKETLYLTALDARVRAGAASEGGIGLEMSNWDAPWYLGNRAWQLRATGTDHDDLLRLVAPRALLVIGGGDADGEHGRRLLNAARGGATATAGPVELLVHGGGHDFPDPVRDTVFAWLGNHVGRAE